MSSEDVKLARPNALFDEWLARDEPYAFRSASGDPVVQPIPMIINCPKCYGQHIDREEWATALKAHKTHLCEHCGELFRLANVPTVGVEVLP